MQKQSSQFVGQIACTSWQLHSAVLHVAALWLQDTKAYCAQMWLAGWLRLRWAAWLYTPACRQGAREGSRQGSACPELESAKPPACCSAVFRPTAGNAAASAASASTSAPATAVSWPDSAWTAAVPYPAAAWAAPAGKPAQQSACVTPTQPSGIEQVLIPRCASTQVTALWLNRLIDC